MDGHNYQYSREFYDRYAQGQEKSVVNKMQQKYWKTKQTLIKVTGKKEDEHVVASDSDLDAKLELFHSIQRTCLELLKVIELYQKRICFLSQEENELGKFLRTQGSQDKTRAGKIMQATGKALCFSSQQRLALRSPLSRLYQEVETFRYRAISDSLLTVNRMEQARTDYRAVLLWMKDVSQELNPDLYKQMEKFRKVQAEVRHTKGTFDKLKTDVCEKVDLLRASRCNLLSHVLTTYQTTLLYFWEKTSHTMAAIHESFKGYQPYEFTTIKSLQDPFDKLISKESKKKSKTKENPPESPEDNQLISLDAQHQDNENDNAAISPALAELRSMLTFDGALDDLLNMKAEEKFIFEESAMTKNLLSDPVEGDSLEKDEMQLLNDILSTTALDAGDLGQEWTAVFGEPLFNTQPLAPATGELEPRPEPSSGFLPSQLLDQNLNSLQSPFYGWTTSGMASTLPPPAPQSPSSSMMPSSTTNLHENINKTPEKDPSKSTKDLSAWYNLFADLDPLSNPDAVGKTDKEHELMNA
ncbi:islet cell autoantigen 1 [Gastrophryne carolinensis]